MSKSELTSDQVSNAIYLPKSHFQKLVRSLQDNGVIDEGEHPAALDGYNFAKRNGRLVAVLIGIEAEKTKNGKKPMPWGL